MILSEGPPSKELAIEAIMRDPATYAAAALIPLPEDGGRPRLHQNWEYILFNGLVSHFQTARKVERELVNPRTWAFVRELAAELLPADEQPPPEPIRWHHFKYVKKRYLRRKEIRAE